MSALAAETAPHDHRWQLRSVDFDSALQIRELVCEDCDEVSFQ